MLLIFLIPDNIKPWEFAGSHGLNTVDLSPGRFIRMIPWPWKSRRHPNNVGSAETVKE